MFGYVIINQSDLSEEELLRYRQCYCGLCHSLKERSGNLSRLMLTFDLTFLTLLLQALSIPLRSSPGGRVRLQTMPQI